MSLPIIFRRAARSEYDDACDFYVSKRPRTATQFIRVIDAVLQAIVVNPDRYPIVDVDIREAPVTGFPFCVYYIVEPDRIDVLSVFHTSRDPSIWQARR